MLKPGGRLAVVSVTEQDEAARPVAEAGFRQVRRERVRQIVPAEIVTATTPDG